MGGGGSKEGETRKKEFQNLHINALKECCTERNEEKDRLDGAGIERALLYVSKQKERPSLQGSNKNRNTLCLQEVSRGRKRIRTLLSHEEVNKDLVDKEGNRTVLCLEESKPDLNDKAGIYTELSYALK